MMLWYHGNKLLSLPSNSHLAVKLIAATYDDKGLIPYLVLKAKCDYVHKRGDSRTDEKTVESDAGA